MESVKLSELRPHSYINYDGEVIAKEEAEVLVASGVNPTLFTVSDEWINGCLMEASRSLKKGEEPAEVYSAPDPYAKRVLY